SDRDVLQEERAVALRPRARADRHALRRLDDRLRDRTLDAGEDAARHRGEVRVLRAVLAELRPLREEVGDRRLARDDQLAALVLLRPRAFEVVGLRRGVVFAAAAVRDVVPVADEEEPPERR